MDENLSLTESALDQARASRDPRFDGRFFIAVISTGIYCRPICKVRDANRANIRYYPTAAAAAAAGFRPCLRCRPEAAPGTPAWLGTSAVVRRALQLINDGALDGCSVEELANRVGIGPRHLHRLFLQHVGASPIAVAQTRRLHFAKRLLDETDLPMTEIALAAGYGSLRRFNSAFQQSYRRTPTQLRHRRRSSDSARGDAVVLRLAYRPPYDWEAIRNDLAARAIPGVERVDAQSYSRLVSSKTGERSPVTIRVNPADDAAALELHVRGAEPSALFQLSSTVRRMFDLAADPASITTLLERDSVLAPLSHRRPGLRISGAWDPFECAVFTFVERLRGPAAARDVMSEIVTRAGRHTVGTIEGLTHLFPAPEALAAMEYSDIGLSDAEAATLRGLAGAVAEKSLDFSAPANEVRTRLTALPGYCGTAASLVILRALGEPDAFPAEDECLQRMLAGSGHALICDELERRSENWRPWRGYAAMHLWRAAHES